MQTSVVGMLQAAGLYGDVINGKKRIEEQMLITITPTGETREHKMAEMDYHDIKIFADEMDIALKHQNPYVAALFAKNAEGMVNLIRAVNVETASGFKGSNGSGRQLDVLMFRAEQFQDPDAAGIAARASWIRAVGIGLNVQFIIHPDALGANTHGDLTMAVNEGIAVFGFANPAATPCVSAIQPNYLAQAYNVQNCDFELTNPFVGDAIVEMKQPLYIYPSEAGRINVRYYRAGNDEMRPIGIWVKMSQALRAIATS